MSARSSLLASIASNHLRRIALRSFAVLARQPGNAAAAAAIAPFVSSALIHGAVPILDPVAGLTTFIVAPESASVQRPST
jgi:hypothetical protein